MKIPSHPRIRIRGIEGEPQLGLSLEMVPLGGVVFLGETKRKAIPFWGAPEERHPLLSQPRNLGVPNRPKLVPSNRSEGSVSTFTGKATQTPKACQDMSRKPHCLGEETHEFAPSVRCSCQCVSCSSASTSHVSCSSTKCSSNSYSCTSGVAPAYPAQVELSPGKLAQEHLDQMHIAKRSCSFAVVYFSNGPVQAKGCAERRRRTRVCTGKRDTHWLPGKTIRLRPKLPRSFARDTEQRALKGGPFYGKRMRRRNQMTTIPMLPSGRAAANLRYRPHVKNPTPLREHCICARDCVKERSSATASVATANDIALPKATSTSAFFPRHFVPRHKSAQKRQRFHSWIDRPSPSVSAEGRRSTG